MTEGEELIVLAAHQGTDPCRCGMPPLDCPNVDNHIAVAYYTEEKK
jgi:hypothetical protein